jgi:hypothetical protein
MPNQRKLKELEAIAKLYGSLSAPQREAQELQQRQQEEQMRNALSVMGLMQTGQLEQQRLSGEEKYRTGMLGEEKARTATEQAHETEMSGLEGQRLVGEQTAHTSEETNRAAMLKLEQARTVAEQAHQTEMSGLESQRLTGEQTSQTNEEANRQALLKLEQQKANNESGQFWQGTLPAEYARVAATEKGATARAKMGMVDTTLNRLGSANPQLALKVLGIENPELGGLQLDSTAPDLKNPGLGGIKLNPDGTLAQPPPPPEVGYLDNREGGIMSPIGQALQFWMKDSFPDKAQREINRQENDADPTNLFNLLFGKKVKPQQ